MIKNLKHLHKDYGLKKDDDFLDQFMLEDFPYYNIINGYKEYFMKICV